MRILLGIAGLEADRGQRLGDPLAARAQRRPGSKASSGSATMRADRWRGSSEP